MRTLDLAFRHDIAIAQKDHLIGDGVDFVQNVAGNDDVATIRGDRAKQRDHFSTSQRIEAIQRFIQYQHSGIVAEGLR